MVKNSQLKRSELLEILQRARSTKERNKAAKLLKRFDPNPRKDLDDENDPRFMTMKKYEQLQTFLCFRCDRVKQSTHKCQWSTSQGLKVICSACHNNLVGQRELDKIRKDNEAYVKYHGKLPQ